MTFLSIRNIRLLPISQFVPAASLLEAFAANIIVACDFAVQGAPDSMVEEVWGYSLGRLHNIDHHANAPRMQRLVSSANLALLWVQEQGRGVGSASTSVVINHTDCDSVLSAAIVAGDLEPLDFFGAAAIAADHSGQANAIADLLQALELLRDYKLSLRNLRLLLDGRPLERDAQLALDERWRKREAAERLVCEGGFSRVRDVFYGCAERSVNGEFFPALLPTAKLIAVFTPDALTGLWVVKVRLGLAAPHGFSLHSLGINSFDPNYGGRWNAGSNKRGGSMLTPNEYAHQLNNALVKLRGIEGSLM